MDRVLRHTIAPVRITIRDADGDLWDSDDQQLEAVVTDSAGAEVDTYAATRESQGTYRIDVPATDTDVLDVYDVAWTGTFDTQSQTFNTQYEVVGGFFFTTTEARAFDNGAMSDTTAYPSQTIVDGREQVEAEIEEACGVAFVPRGRRVLVDGSGTSTLFLPHGRIHSVVSVAVDDEAVDLADVTLYGDEGRLVVSAGSFATGTLNVAVLVEHGYAQPPARIKRAALILLKDRIIGSNVHDRALSHSDESGTMTLAVAGTNGVFGIPEVDAAVAQYAETVPLVG